MSVEPRAYVTYFDQRYLARAVVMLRSLRRHDAQAEIFTLCFDQIAYEVTQGLGDLNIAVLSPDAINEFEPGLAECKDRARWAFYATHKPVLPLYVLARRPHLASIAHIDSDAYFFSTPAPLFDEIGAASIAISPHRFIKRFEHQKVFGLFNAGFIHWRNDALGLRSLADYRADCLRWCEPRFESDGRFMNQGYLTLWPQRYPGVHVITHPGVNLASWNVAGHSLARDRDLVTVDGVPLVFYHFTNLMLDSLGIWRTVNREFEDNLKLVLEAIYRPYLEEVEQNDRWLRRRGLKPLPLEKPWKIGDAAPVRRGPWPRSPRDWFRRARWLIDPAKRTERAEV